MSLVRRHPLAWDVASATVLGVLVLLEVHGTDQDVPLGLATAVGIAMTVPFALRRRAPVLVGLLVLGAFTIQGLAGDWDLEPQTELLSAVLAFWTIGSRVEDPTAMRAAGAGLLLVLLHEPGDMIVQGPLMTGVFAAGRLMRSRSELAAALERDRGEGERQAVAQERARIARELHDVVAHSISLMTVQAGAERLALGTERRQTTEALTQIEQTGRQALSEMRRLLGMLRLPGEQVDLAPQPGLGQLDALAARVSRAGLAVELTVSGQAGPVSPGVDISAYRIVQEGLTNALRHAHAGRADVRVAYDDDAVEIEITDDGRGGVVNGGGGHGLSGMRERVALYGGTFAAGPAPSGGWRLHARLPRQPAP